MIAIFGGGGIAIGIASTVDDCQIITADVTDGGGLWKAVAKAKARTAIITAGYSHPQEIEGSLGDHWDEEIRVNLIGSYNVACAALEYGVETLIFIASVAGLYGKPGHSGYSASKAGVISLVQSLAMEGHNAYCISPGRVNTKMREKDYPGEDPRTRLDPTQIGEVVQDILVGKYTPGDNIIIRKIGYTTHLRVDDGEPWKSWLRVGQPAVV